jgi:RimJ/RimL family protein N-acetyltransferase
MAEPGEIRGESVILRLMARADVDEMARWPRFGEPELDWANLELSHPSDRDVYFERNRSNSTRRRYVILDETGAVIGTVGLRNLDFAEGEGTLGIIVRADAVGRGYGTDAIRALTRFAFDVLGLRRVLLDVAVNNRRARHVYDKLGFVRIGQHVGPQGVIYVDMALDRAAFERRWSTPTRPSSPVR